MSIISLPLLRYILTAALRDKIVMTLFIMIAVGVSTSIFLGSSSLVEQQELAIVFGAGGLRFLGALGVILFSCFHIRRSFETKEVEFLLSRPISRLNFLLSHAVAFMVISITIAVTITLSLILVGDPNLYGLILWGVSLAMEYSIIAVSSLFFSMVLTSAASAALATLGLYVLSRMIGMLLGITDVMERKIMIYLGYVMEFLSIFIPRLDLMAQTSWLVYGVDDVDKVEFLMLASNFSKTFFEHVSLLGFVSMQGLVFIALLLSAASIDLIKKQF